VLQSRQVIETTDVAIAYPDLGHGPAATQLRHFASQISSTVHADISKSNALTL
jgi:hypothetical protein